MREITIPAYDWENVVDKYSVQTTAVRPANQDVLVWQHLLHFRLLLEGKGILEKSAAVCCSMSGRERISENESDLKDEKNKASRKTFVDFLEDSFRYNCFKIAKKPVFGFSKDIFQIWRDYAKNRSNKKLCSLETKTAYLFEILKVEVLVT